MPPSYQRYPQRIQASTATWDPFEFGCYDRLLDAQWELGDRGLPDNLDRLAAAVRCPAGEIDRFRAAWDELLEEKFPVCDDGRRRNPPLEKIRREQSEYRRRRSEAGKAGAAARHGKRMATAKQTHGASIDKKVALRSPVSGLRSPVSDLQSPEEDGAQARPAAESDPVLFEFPTTASRRCAATAWALRRSKLEEWIEAYPQIDVQTAVRRALQWCRDNPAKRKTASGMPRFINNWLADDAKKAKGGEVGYSDRELEAMT